MRSQISVRFTLSLTVSHEYVTGTLSMNGDINVDRVEPKSSRTELNPVKTNRVELSRVDPNQNKYHAYKQCNLINKNTFTILQITHVLISNTVHCQKVMRKPITDEDRYITF